MCEFTVALTGFGSGEGKGEAGGDVEQITARKPGTDCGNMSW